MEYDAENGSTCAPKRHQHSSRSTTGKKPSATASPEYGPLPYRTVKPPRYLDPRSSSSLKLLPRTPLTPEESPTRRRSSKRRGNTDEQAEHSLDPTQATQARKRSNEGELAFLLCVCKADFKIPRPRNAFILYRQAQQAHVAAQNPGLANPDISKIIGEQWQRQPEEVKAKWKKLADEEKIRHQQQYPNYRYQPKRNGRRNSVAPDATPASGEEGRCPRCGGLKIAAPTLALSSGQDQSSFRGHSPLRQEYSYTSGGNPMAKSRDFSIQTPVRQFQRQRSLSPPTDHHQTMPDEGVGPETKRRRHNSDLPAALTRQPPPRYAQGQIDLDAVPASPYPEQSKYPPIRQLSVGSASGQLHRDSLPAPHQMVSGRGSVSSQGSAGPGIPLLPPSLPPPPTTGYAQHRAATIQSGYDRSLTLPPIQIRQPQQQQQQQPHVDAEQMRRNSRQPSIPIVLHPASEITAIEHIMSLSFKYKIKVLSQIAQTAGPAIGRGPLIAVEGEDTFVVAQVAELLRDCLAQVEELDVKCLEGPDVFASEAASKAELMAEYHHLAAEWLGKSIGIVEGLRIEGPPGASSLSGQDAAMIDDEMEVDSTAGKISPRQILEARKTNENTRLKEREENAAKDDYDGFGNHADGKTKKHSSNEHDGTGLLALRHTRSSASLAPQSRTSTKFRGDGRLFAPLSPKGTSEGQGLEGETEFGFAPTHRTNAPVAAPAVRNDSIATALAKAAPFATRPSSRQKPIGPSSTSPDPPPLPTKPVTIIANYTLCASNTVACRIPIGAPDPYPPGDHWQWTATHWRGVVGPDLTIYVREPRDEDDEEDALPILAGPQQQQQHHHRHDLHQYQHQQGFNVTGGMGVGAGTVQIENVEGRRDLGLVVVAGSRHHRPGVRLEGGVIETSVMRRVGFEVGEWVRGFGERRGS